MKSLLKKILTHLMVFCLIHVQLGGSLAEFSLFSKALAQSESQQENQTQQELSVGQDEQQAQTDALSQQTGSSNATTMNGVDEEEAKNNSANQALTGADDPQQKSYKPTGSGIIKTESYLALIIMVAIAIIALQLLTSCTKYPADMIAAAVAGVAFIAGEIITIMKAKEEIQFQEVSYTEHSDGTITGAQKEALDKQIASYESARDSANTRKMLQGIAALAFFAAAVLAGVMYASELAVQTTVTAVLPIGATTTNKAGTAACTGQWATACAGPWYGACFPPMQTVCLNLGAACQGMIGGATAIWVKLLALHTLLQPSGAKFAEMTGLIPTIGSTVAPCASMAFPTPYWAPVSAQVEGVMASYLAIHNVNHAPCKPVMGAGTGRIDPSGKKTNNYYAGMTCSGDKKNNPTSPMNISEFIGKHINTKAVMAEVEKSQPQKVIQGVQKSIKDFALKNDDHMIDVVVDKSSNLSKYFRGFKKSASKDQFYNIKFDHEKAGNPQEAEKDLHQYLRIHESYRMRAGELKSISYQNYQQFAVLFSPVKNVAIQYDLKGILAQAGQMGIDLFVPRAEAFDMRTLGLGAVGVALILVLVPGNWAIFDNFMASEITRIYVWTVMGALATAAALMSAKIASTMEENIKELTRIRDKLVDYKQGGATNPGLTAPGLAPGAVTPVNIPLNSTFPLSDDGSAFPCVETNPDGSCIPLTQKLENQNKEMAENGVDLQGFEVAASVASGVASLADNIQGNSSLKAADLNSAQGLLGQQGALNDALVRIKEKINSKRKDLGRPEINFAKNENDLLNQIKNASLKALKDKGQSPRSALALFGGAPSTVAGLEGEAKKGEGKARKNFFFKAPNFKSPSFKMAKFKLPQNKSQAGAKSKDQVNNDEPDYEKGLQGYQTDQNDIVKDKSASLWKILNYRYRKSAYPRLFKAR